MLYDAYPCLSVYAMLLGIEQIAQLAHIDMEADAAEQLPVIYVLQYELCEAVGAALHKHLVVADRHGAEERLLTGRQGMEQLVRAALHLIEHVHSHGKVALLTAYTVLRQYDAVYGKRAQDDATLL